MKKALVITCILVAALSLLASAAGMCSGEWETTLDINMIALSDACLNGLFGPGWMDQPSLFLGLSSTLTLSYAVGSFLFGSTSGFDASLRYSSQSFDVTGALGAFTISAAMTFLPQAVVLSEQKFRQGDQPDEEAWLLYNNSGDACDDCEDPGCCCPAGDDGMCDLTVLVRAVELLDPKACGLERCSLLAPPIVTIEPRFKDVEVSASVSLAGIEIEGLKLLNAWEGTTTEEQIFEWTVCDELILIVFEDSNKYFDNVVQTGPAGPWPCEHDETMETVFAWGTLPPPQTCSCSTGGDDDIGSGFRLKLSGAAGPMSVTSYTYFNLSESDNPAETDSGCPVLGKKGDLKVAGDCSLGFTEEYLMVEGIPLCCDMELDAALKMVCPEASESWSCVCEEMDLEKTQSGSTVTISFPEAINPPDCDYSSEIVAFEYLQLLVHDIPFIPGMYDLTASIKLTTDEKEFSLCGQPAFDYPTCFSITLLANWEEDEAHNEIANKLTGIDIKDLSFTCECNGVTFSSKTVLYDLPTNALKTIASSEVLSFLVPLDCDSEDCPPFIDNGDGVFSGPLPGIVVPDVGEVQAGRPGDKIFLEYWETPKYKYYAWESLSIGIDGDACCGGAFDFDVDIYTGKEYEANPEFCGAICKTDTTKECCEEEQNYKCCWSRDPNYEEVGKLGSLFSWMATDVSGTFGIFSNFDLVVEASVSFRGWETFSLGFEFTI